MAARCGHVCCFGRVGLLPIALCLSGSREYDRRVLGGRDERDRVRFRPQGAYSQSSGLYAVRQARRTGLCIGVAASSPASRPQAWVAVTSHDRVSKKAGQDLDGSEIGSGFFLRKETP